MLDGIRNSVEKGRTFVNNLPYRRIAENVKGPTMAVGFVGFLYLGILPGVSAAHKELVKLFPDQAIPGSTLTSEQLRQQRLDVVIHTEVPNLGSYDIRWIEGETIEVQYGGGITEPGKEDDLRRESLRRLILECGGLRNLAFVPRTNFLNPQTYYGEVDFYNPNCLPQIPR